MRRFNRVEDITFAMSHSIDVGRSRGFSIVTDALSAVPLTFGIDRTSWQQYTRSCKARQDKLIRCPCSFRGSVETANNGRDQVAIPRTRDFPRMLASVGMNGL